MVIAGDHGEGFVLDGLLHFEPLLANGALVFINRHGTKHRWETADPMRNLGIRGWTRLESMGAGLEGHIESRRCPIKVGTSVESGSRHGGPHGS